MIRFGGRVDLYATTSRQLIPAENQIVEGVPSPGGLEGRYNPRGRFWRWVRSPRPPYYQANIMKKPVAILSHAVICLENPTGWVNITQPEKRDGG